jgi:hypothetical protein
LVVCENKLAVAVNKIKVINVMDNFFIVYPPFDYKLRTKLFERILSWF